MKSSLGDIKISLFTQINTRMGSQLCGIQSQYQQLQKELMQTKQIQNFLLRYPLIDQKFKIDKNYIPIPQLQSISKFNNSIFFKSRDITRKDTQNDRNFCGIIFEECTQYSQKNKNYNALFYQGQLSEFQVKQGKGKAVFDNGDVYEGEWKDNSISGHGVYTQNQNKAIYQGQFKNWVKEGKGKLIFNTDKQFIYSGQFKSNQIDGQGIIEFQDGSSYQGHCRNGLQEGYGVYQTKSMKYEGTWVKGLMCGAGTAVWYSENGQIISKYTGEYQQGKKHGFGEYAIKNGKLLRGQWFNGKFTLGTNSYIIQ